VGRGGDHDRRHRRPRVAHLTTTDLTLRYLLLGQLRRLAAEGYEVTGISAPGPNAATLEAAGIRFLPWRNATRAWNPVADLRAVAELVSLLRRERFDLLHTHNPKPGVLGRWRPAWPGSRWSSTPCTACTPPPRTGCASGRPCSAWSGWPAAARTWSSTRARRTWAGPGGSGWPARAAATCSANGTDLGHFDPALVPPERVAALRRELGLPADALVVGAVGRLVAEKGYRELFAAARAVRQADPRVRFVAVGAPDLDKADAIGQAELARAAGDVVVTGWRDDVRDLLAVMDVFVLASWREGMPRSAIEAAAMGRPLVLTDIRGCREVARHQREGPTGPAPRPGRAGRSHRAPDRRPRPPPAAGHRGQGSHPPALQRGAGGRAGGGMLPRPVRPAVPGPRRGRPLRQRHPPTDLQVIRRATAADAEAMARLHTEGMPDAFLPTLGPRFLARLYRAVATDPEAVALVAEGVDGVVGFAAGVASVAASTGASPAATARRRPWPPRPTWPAPVWPAGSWRPSATRPTAPRQRPAARRRAAVDRGRPRPPGRRDRPALADGVLAGLAGRGVDDIKVVVGAANKGANRFYAKVGFTEGRPAHRPSGNPEQRLDPVMPFFVASPSPSS
jgi:glycosyltransferase involved in cell wall biosynthesis